MTGRGGWPGTRRNLRRLLNKERRTSAKGGKRIEELKAAIRWLCDDLITHDDIYYGPHPPPDIEATVQSVTGHCWGHGGPGALCKCDPTPSPVSPADGGVS